MTILTKPFTEKKGDKLEVPLVENEKLSVPVSLAFTFYLWVELYTNTYIFIYTYICVYFQ